MTIATYAAGTVLMNPLNGGTGAAAKPSYASLLGLLESGPLDAGAMTDLALCVSLRATDTPDAETSLADGSLQLETSVDGNTWLVAGTPAPVAITVEGDYMLPVANAPPRFLPAGA